MESRLRKLDGIGTALASAPRSRLRVVAMDREAGMAGHAVLSTYVVAALTAVIRRAAAGAPWQHTLFLLGAEKLRGDVLDRLADACEASRTGLVVGYRSIPASVRERLGRGNAAVAFMRLGNAADAKAASEQIGTEHRFVVSQLTDTVGISVTDTQGRLLHQYRRHVRFPGPDQFGHGHLGAQPWPGRQPGQQFPPAQSRNEFPQPRLQPFDRLHRIRGDHRGHQREHGVGSQYVERGRRQ